MPWWKKVVRINTIAEDENKVYNATELISRVRRFIEVLKLRKEACLELAKDIDAKKAIYENLSKNLRTS